MSLTGQVIKQGVEVTSPQPPYKQQNFNNYLHGWSISCNLHPLQLQHFNLCMNHIIFLLLLVVRILAWLDIVLS